MNMNAQPKTYAKPVDFDQLYPGRFIKAGELLGKKVTLTITDVELEGLLGDDGKEKAKAIISFKESDKKLVACKTNGICLKEMFGKSLAEWTNKRVTIFPDVWNGEPCIRIWGSPDIAADLKVTVTLPRRRPFEKTMHKVGGAAKAVTSSDAVPSYSATTAIAALRNATSLAELDAKWKDISADYRDTNREVPIDVEALRNELRETFA